MKIRTADLLDFIIKAQKLSILNNFCGTNLGYKIVLRHDWCENGNFYNKTVFITAFGESSYDTGDYEFYEMYEILNQMLEKEEQKKTKEQKCQELIAGLTDEEKKILEIYG